MPVITSEISQHLTNAKAIRDYIKAEYPEGLLGELLFKADASKCKATDIFNVLNPKEQKKTKYKLVIVGDAKAKTNKFALVSITGEPLYYGHFLEPRFTDCSEKQALCEMNALVYAIRMIRDYCNAKRIKYKDFTLHYLTDSTIVLNSIGANVQNYYSHLFRTALIETPIQVKVDWIRGIDNMADGYTLIEAGAKHISFPDIDRYLERK